MPPNARAEEAVRLDVAAATALAERALRRIGFAADEAQAIARPLLDADLCGYPSLGLTRILTIAENPRSRAPRDPVRVTRETPVSAALDGGNQLGFLSLQHATRILTEKAQASGMAVVSVRNSWLSGRSAFYVEQAARSGLVVLHFASGPAVVAAAEGTVPVLGTNPVAVAVPREPDPFVLDLATSAISQGDVVLAQRQGAPLPPGVAVDRTGRTTRDAAEAMAGAILPFGGHKGFALALCVQALCLLSGARIDFVEGHDFGFLFLAFNPEVLLGRAAWQGELDALIDGIKRQQIQANGTQVRIPSERAFAERARRRIEGISFPAWLVERLETL
jgi:LDH2 family malate/lactate/ureidoglycolate dehydrogenase